MTWLRGQRSTRRKQSALALYRIRLRRAAIVPTADDWRLVFRGAGSESSGLRGLTPELNEGVEAARPPTAPDRRGGMQADRAFGVVSHSTGSGDHPFNTRVGGAYLKMPLNIAQYISSYVKASLFG